MTTPRIIRGRLFMVTADGSPTRGPRGTFPAIVVEVSSVAIDATVFHYGGAQFVPGIPHKDHPGASYGVYWDWPNREE